MFSRKIRAYKLANPNATAKEIAEVVGVRVNYVYQALRFKPKRIKKVKPVVETKPTEGQQTIRNEIFRLNKDIDDWRTLYLENLDLVEQLQQDVIGYRAVISYLQGQLDGVTV